LHYLTRLNQYLLVMGIPGLLAISFLDSAAMPLAGGPDAVILLLAWRRPALTYLIVLAATIGSTLGCMVLYGIGQKSGEKALARFNPEKTAWVERKMQEHGIWAIIVAVVAPPPFPTKLVILAAGVLRTGKMRFAAGVVTGRLLRYSLVGYLGAAFGDEAAQVLKAHYPAISLALIGVILLIILIRSLRSRIKPANI
jgi:membrane protein YqaA with SNARE-associated domain